MTQLKLNNAITALYIILAPLVVPSFAVFLMGHRFSHGQPGAIRRSASRFDHLGQRPSGVAITGAMYLRENIDLFFRSSFR